VNREEMNAWVSEALTLIPKGDLNQNLLRDFVSAKFKNALGPQPEHPEWTPAQIVQAEAARLGGNLSWDDRLRSLSWPEN
jgi:hypothetical protein